MNALIIQEEKREKARQRELDYAASEDERDYLIKRHQEERNVASNRVKSLINTHLLEMQSVQNESQRQGVPEFEASQKKMPRRDEYQPIRSDKVRNEYYSDVRMKQAELLRSSNSRRASNRQSIDAYSNYD